MINNVTIFLNYLNKVYLQSLINIYLNKLLISEKRSYKLYINYININILQRQYCYAIF